MEMHSNDPIVTWKYLKLRHGLASYPEVLKNGENTDKNMCYNTETTELCWLLAHKAEDAYR